MKPDFSLKKFMIQYGKKMFSCLFNVGISLSLFVIIVFIF
jgi:hypothetical protein